MSYHATQAVVSEKGVTYNLTKQYETSAKTPWNRQYRIGALNYIWSPRTGRESARLIGLFALATFLFFSAAVACTEVDGPPTPTVLTDEPTLEPNIFGYEITEVSEPASEPNDYPNGAIRGGVFRFAAGNTIVPDPVIGDGPTGDYLNSQWVVFEIYSGLTKIDETQAPPVQPDLADKFTVDTTGRRYEFTLRQGLKFSDGSPVTASDFKWSWERALNPETRSPRAADVLGPIEGAYEVAQGSTTELSGVKAVDERVLQITLVEPRADFPAVLADPVAVVLKQENVENWGIDWGSVAHDYGPAVFNPQNELPVGTGPFKLVSFDNRLGPWVLKRNQLYNGRPPYLDGIEIITEFARLDFETWIVRESAAFTQEAIDMFFGYPEAVAYQELLIEGPPQPKFLILNSNLPPFDDIHFRRAFASAVSADHHILDHPAESIEAAHGLVPPGFPGFNADLQLLDDPELAEMELAESKYADKQVEIKYEPLSWGFLEEEFYALTGVWSDKLGVQPEYNPLSGAGYNWAIEDGTLQMMGFEVTPAYPDPYAIFRVFDDPFKDGNRSPETKSVSRMLQDAATEQDAVRKLEKYADLEQYLIDQALVIPIRWYNGNYTYAFQTWVNDFVWPKYGGSKFKDVWFDETAPERTLRLP